VADEDEESQPEPVDEDRESHAADDPTAVWDEDSLRAAGLEELAKGKAESDRPAPATGRGVKGEDDSSIIVTQKGTAGEPSRQAAGPKSAALSWAITIALAAGLGLAVYFLVRMLR